MGTRAGRRGTSALLAFLTVVWSVHAIAQPPLPSGAERRLALEKLAVLGSVLYLGAHPDDENTALLAYLAKGRKLRTAYLSLTRGDGGQNLIGTEQGETLGVIRTEELAAARRVDGAEQYFTRAVDFGYSKTPEETLGIWGHDAVLADVVWVLRTFRPDVVITRFPENSDGGHGHHTASATLAREAFVAAGDRSRFPEQLAFVAPWQPKRLLWNAWRPPDTPPDAPPAPGRLVVDLGTYDPLLGQAFTELAATARSFHKSQGFGSAPRRGSQPNELELVAGAPATHDLMEGVDTTWRRVSGGEAVAAALDRALESSSDRAPERAVGALLDALDALDALAPDPWVAVKRREILAALRSCTGLWLEATASEPMLSPGATARIKVTAINRSTADVRLARISPPFGGEVLRVDSPLENNRPRVTEVSVAVPADTPYSQPYWLEHPRHGGLDRVDDQRLVGLLESPPPVNVGCTLTVAGHELSYDLPVEYRTVDPVEGERSRDVMVAPAVTVDFDLPVLLLPDAAPRSVKLRATASRPGATATVSLRAPAGFEVSPSSIDVRLEKAGEESALAFTLTPPSVATVGDLRVELLAPRREWARRRVAIDHPHIPPRILLPEATLHVVRLEAKAAVSRVGYIPGAGDEVAAVLRQLGIEVVVLDEAALAGANLAGFDAIVTGVRAFNTRVDLPAALPRLLDFVAAGGTLVVQYVNERGLLVDQLGPFPLKVSRTRVTDENAPVHFLLPDATVLRSPNPIVVSDFAGWVQERGLSFASEWDTRYTAPIGMADPGEKESAGALLQAHHGRGTFVYTGLAFFRQLPAGNPGAVRLFLNLLGASRTHG